MHRTHSALSNQMTRMEGHTCHPFPSSHSVLLPFFCLSSSGLVVLVGPCYVFVGVCTVWTPHVLGHKCGLMKALKIKSVSKSQSVGGLYVCFKSKSWLKLLREGAFRQKSYLHGVFDQFLTWHRQPGRWPPFQKTAEDIWKYPWFDLDRSSQQHMGSEQDHWYECVSRQGLY